MLTSIVVGLLVDNEMLDYAEPIARIWPEFSARGKAGGNNMENEKLKFLVENQGFGNKSLN